MSDIDYDQQSSPVRLTNHDETYTVAISPLDELTTSDILNNGGLDIELTVGTTAVELKVETSKKANRKYVIFIPLDRGIKFGFSSTTQNLPIFKSQVMLFPVGSDTEIWFKADQAGKKVAIGEL